LISASSLPTSFPNPVRAVPMSFSFFYFGSSLGLTALLIAPKRVSADPLPSPRSLILFSRSERSLLQSARDFYKERELSALKASSYAFN
jgi:hypothetical protein